MNPVIRGWANYFQNFVQGKQ
ncbi:group II intron maturase-specific domain-containing protein [Acetivibrio clariflavus]